VNHSEQRPPTLKDVAKIAAVSHVTVSRVMRNVGNVSPETRAAVLAAAQQLGYTPNRMAQGLKRGFTRIISTIVPRLDGSPVSEIVEILNQEFSKVGMWLHLHCSFGDATRQLEELRLIQGTSDLTFLVLTSDLIVRDRPDLMAATVRTIRQMSSPIIFLDRYIELPNVAYVCSDNEAGVRDAVNYLVSMGHSRIGYLTGPLLSSVAERLKGYRDGLQHAGIPFNPCLVESLPSDSYHDGAEAAQCLLRRVPDLTALITYNHFATAGAVSAIRQVGKRIPEDISLVAFDDVPSISAALVPLTHIEQDAQNIARRAMELALDMQSGGEPKRIRVRPRLVIGGSTGPVRNGL
jgi:LacI family transcriptional regulator